MKFILNICSGISSLIWWILPFIAIHFLLLAVRKEKLLYEIIAIIAFTIMFANLEYIAINTFNL